MTDLTKSPDGRRRLPGGGTVATITQDPAGLAAYAGEQSPTATTPPDPVYGEGFAAWERGQSFTDCPYPAHDGRRDAWSKGWMARANLACVIEQQARPEA